ncbi:MAG: CoA-transferase [Pseudorhodoplanes sp.]|uniref:CoA-transferase n=1 Tax=Pseudorhodoplanes sp. TaxID=1934341 RepID=UPI003D0C90F6
MTAGPTRAEFLAHALAALLAGARTVAIGANSPIPAAAALFAQTREPGMVVSVHGSPRHNIFTNGGAEQFDFAASGRLDCFVLGGVQIDGKANINLVSTGDYRQPNMRFPGSFGSPLVYFVVPRVILFREEHSLRSLVSQVDFISAPGIGPEGVYRPGGPTYLLTSKALFRFDRAKERFALDSVHPGCTVEDIVSTTGFDFDLASGTPVTANPSSLDLAMLRGKVRSELADIYPAFTRHAFAA